MKIAIASNGDTDESLVSDIGGRAPYYLIFDGTELIKVIKNPYDTGNKAGINVAQMLADEKVELIIGGKFGPVMASALGSQNIQYKEIVGVTIKQALTNQN